MTWMFADRRAQRSAESHAALRYQLEHTQKSGGLEALVLADENGMILASAGDVGVCAELGAIAPLFGKSVFRMPLPPLLRGGEVAVRAISLHGQELFLASLGGGVARDALLASSLSGVRRILAAN